MSEASWHDLFATVRYLIANVVPILTAFIALLGAFAALKAANLGERNSRHLREQDVSLGQVYKKVDGQMSMFTAATRETTERLATAVKETSDATAEALRAEIARLHGRLEQLSVVAPGTPVIINDPTWPASPPDPTAPTNPEPK